MLNWSRRAKMRAKPACGWSLAFSKSIRAVLTSLRPMPSICAPRRCDCWIATANTWCRFSRTTDRIFCAMRNRSLHATSQPWNNRLTFGWNAGIWRTSRPTGMRSLCALSVLGRSVSSAVALVLSGSVNKPLTIGGGLRTLPKPLAPTAIVAARYGHGRWQIENEGFKELVNQWHADHYFHHHPLAIVALWLILFAAHALFHCFWRGNLKTAVRK